MRELLHRIKTAWIVLTKGTSVTKPELFIRHDTYHRGYEIMYTFDFVGNYMYASNIYTYDFIKGVIEEVENETI